jgi:hypothetical protein
VRYAIAAVVTAGALAVPASAADLDPRLLVLQSADVPPGFVLDREDTGVRTNEDEGRESRQTRELIARLGRVTGYEAEWDQARGMKVIHSRADVFRATAGARMLLDLYATGFRTSGIKGLRRTAVRIGDEGAVFHGGGNSDLAWVSWRSGRVTATLAGWGIPRTRTIALARIQQRRIAAGLR